MDVLQNLMLGASVAFSPENLIFALVGVVLGTAIGVLPGLGPLATISLLLPVTFYMNEATALIMLAGIYYGAQYGGSTTAILANMPGEASSVITTLDGHAMTKNGRGGAALFIAAVGSFAAGCVSTLLIAFASPALAGLALSFTSPEYFSLMLAGLVGSVIMAQGSVVRAVGMVLVGVLLGSVGADVQTGVLRFSFGSLDLMSGIGVSALAIGLFGVAEILRNLERPIGQLSAAATGKLWPTREEARRSVPAIARGTVVGSILGLLPGGGAMLSSFVSYGIEKRVSKTPEQFGKGMIEGVAGPESANNAGAQVSFIPMLSLGIPSNAIMAVMIGALMLQGITPGPRIIEQNPDLFWGLIVSMWVGNLMLLVINLPLVGVWIAFLKIPYKYVFPVIIAVCAVGAYAAANSPFEVWVMLVFGIAGYILYKIGCDATPLVLGFILGPLMEENFRRSLLISRGDPMIFLERPISLGFLIAAAALLVLALRPAISKRRQEIFVEED